MFQGVGLSARSLRKVLPSGGRDLVILDDVDLDIEQGEFVAVVGPSGSGKSTLLGLLAGLDRPTSGEVLLDEQHIEDASEDELALLRRSKIGFVYQSFQLLANLTARENILLPMELQGQRNAGDRAEELLQSVGLSARGHHYPIQLSGGEQQRVALARAFAPQPKVLFADEPTGNLDLATGASVLRLLVALREDHGSTLVLVTHDEAVAALADRVIRLEDGRVVAERLMDGEAKAISQLDVGASAIGSKGIGATKIGREGSGFARSQGDELAEAKAAEAPASPPLGA